MSETPSEKVQDKAAHYLLEGHVRVQSFTPSAGFQQKDEREKIRSWQLLGVAVFLRKPVSYQDVAGAIRTLLHARDGGGPARADAAPRGETGARGLTERSPVAKDPSDAMPASRR